MERLLDGEPASPFGQPAGRTDYFTGACAQAGLAISARRFFARPASLWLSATGLVLPYRLAVSRPAAAPFLVGQSTTARARASESA
jgi:hypothetical protein